MSRSIGIASIVLISVALIAWPAAINAAHWQRNYLARTGKKAPSISTFLRFLAFAAAIGAVLAFIVAGLLAAENA